MRAQLLTTPHLHFKMITLTNTHQLLNWTATLDKYALAHNWATDLNSLSDNAIVTTVLDNLGV
jgi:hypothetical protein